jgi:uncharacterized membrane protein
MLDARGIARVTLSPQRLEALTDAVFAIVMTLLVLELSIPAIAEGSAHAGLWPRLIDMWPKFLSYGVTFLMLGFMWIFHHRQFSHIKRMDNVFAWINITALMFVALLPFSTSLLGEYIDEQVAVLIYGGNFIACTIARYIAWLYAAGNYRLVDRNIDPQEVKIPKVYLPISIVVILIGMGISFLSPIASICIFAALLIFSSVRSTLVYRVGALHQSSK